MSDYARYSRQIVLREVGVNGQSLLRDSTALIIGIGGLGSPASLYLAGAGLGRLILSDRDHVERSNLQRQIVYRSADLGRAKLDAAADNLRALNPECRIETRPGPLDDSGLAAAIGEADIVLDCSDNFPTRFAVNAACVAARKPLVSGAAIRFEGQIALFVPGGPCYACLFGEHGEATETCEEAGVLGPVVGVIGAMQALIAIKALLGIGDDAGRLQLWDALKLSWRSLAIARDPHCRVCGVPT
ncbi:molybdopterin-synthase adenylyltransferase MoeB [Nevskia sp.]|uniref:HesA/MoeB/ThiF family protein n=1 Tax=Nevskia sp. TaxID=1929292 RepID=UPI0025ED76B7|nr:molybdopterin-synthase adenylyltransferase MoeB [Nevskia sp.]